MDSPQQTLQSPLDESRETIPNNDVRCDRKSSLNLDFTRLRRIDVVSRRVRISDGQSNPLPDYVNTFCTHATKTKSETLKFQESDRPKAVFANGNVFSSSFNRTFVINDTFDNLPVVLTSPDVDKIKLSTPDMDNYLFQLQQELSFKTPEIGQSACIDSDILITPQIERLESLGDREENPSASMHSAASGMESLVLQSENNLSCTRGMFVMPERVSTERGFNSFDSGFSDISVKAEIESELEEEFPESGELSWADKFNSLAHHGLNAYVNNKDAHRLNYEQTKLDGCSFAVLQDFSATSGDCKSYFKSQSSSLLTDLNQHTQPGDNIIAQRHHHRSKEQQRNKQERYRNQHEVGFNLSDKMLVESPNTKASFKDEINACYEFTYSSLDSNSGGICSEYSSFDDGSKTPCVQNAAISNNNNNIRPHTYLLAHSSCKGIRHDEAFPNSRPANASQCRIRHDATAQTKRKTLRRQNAESESSHFEDSTANKHPHNPTDVQTRWSKEHRYLANTLSSLKVEPLATGGAWPEKQATGSGVQYGPINLTEQESIKLQRKRARNRLAATKCRNRKLEKINVLKAEVEFLKDLNSKYVDRVHCLRQEIDRLKCHITSHVTRGCDLSGLLGALR